MFSLLFDLDRYVILIGQGQFLILNWSGVSTMYGSKVLNVINEIKELTGAMTAKRRHQAPPPPNIVEYKTQPQL